MTRPVQLAIIQMVSSVDVDRSLTAASKLIDEAAKDEPVAIFLPENFASLGNPDPSLVGRNESKPSGPIRSFLREKATITGCWIFAGTFPLISRPDGSTVSDGRVRAASLVVSPEGSELGRYDKIHMFDALVDDDHRAYQESDFFEAGQDVVSVSTGFARVGLTVCYDLRFPELYRKLAGAELITAPSAFTVPTGEAHFELLMRARAVENTCFMVAACQGGSHDSGRETFGHSMVVNPWGEVVARLQQGEGVLPVLIDLALIDEVSHKMPVLTHRRI